MRHQVLRSICLLALSSVLVACEDKIETSPNAGAPPRAPAPPPAPVAPPAAPAVPVDESDFTESANSRDPFRSFARAFVEENKGLSRSQRDVILPEYSLDELKLIGIVSRIQPAKAMLLDPTGKGHVIQRGQFVGKADVVQTSGASGSAYEVNWRVDRIRDDNVVLVRGDPSNPDVPTMTRVIPLRPDSTPTQ